MEAGRLNETLIGTSPSDIEQNVQTYNDSLIAVAAVVDTRCITLDGAAGLHAAGYLWNSSTR